MRMNRSLLNLTDASLSKVLFAFLPGQVFGDVLQEDCGRTVNLLHLGVRLRVGIYLDLRTIAIDIILKVRAFLLRHQELHGHFVSLLEVLQDFDTPLVGGHPIVLTPLS